MAIPDYQTSGAGNKANISGIENREGITTGADVNDSFSILMADLRRMYDALRTGSFWYGADSGAANAYVVTVAAEFAPTAYVAGQMFAFKAATANTGATTLNVNGLGVKAVKLNGAALVADDIKAGDVVFVIYDGTDLQMLGGARFFALAKITAPDGTITLDAKQDTVTLANGNGITITHAGKTLTFTFNPGDDFTFGGAINLSGATLTLPSSHSNGNGPRSSGTSAPPGTPATGEVYYRYST